jgi:hypothetical protein
LANKTEGYALLDPLHYWRWNTFTGDKQTFWQCLRAPAALSFDLAARTTRTLTIFPSHLRAPSFAHVQMLQGDWPLPTAVRRVTCLTLVTHQIPVLVTCFNYQERQNIESDLPSVLLISVSWNRW